ncbi:cilia- and flagella-associated protein 157-like [Clytia hemisphaerica]|uniref:Cilia- and flagella-associated protein 157 n=1 Tax=Clytia hemisphaerica TaxID=252671 RepID=A0A7M5XI24_9CNID
MAKKKKGGKKSGKNKSATKSAKSNSVTVDKIFDELSREFYLVQIRDLELKISRYQTKCDELDLRNKDLEKQFDQQASDKKEIVSFLKKQLEQRSDEIADLQEKIIGVQQAKDIQKDKYEVEITTVKTEMQEVKDQLTSENMVLQGKLTSLEEFRVQKETLLNKFADMEQLLRDKEEDHKEQIYQLERKAVVDKDRLKKEMILRVNTVAAEFRKVSNKQMADTTKRTIRENVMINSQLSKMSDKTVELITENDEIKLKNKNHKQHLDVLEGTEKELIRKNAANQKLIRMLTAKAREQEETLMDFMEKESSYKKLESDHAKLEEVLETLQKDHGSFNEEHLALTERYQELKKERDTVLDDKNYLIGILSDATQVLKQALQHEDPTEDAGRVEMKNTNLLYKVIEILKVAVEMGVGIQLDDFLAKRTLIAKKKLHCGLPSQMTMQSPPHAAHYKLGDLGIVPPRKKSPTKKKTDKTKAVYCSDEQLAKGTPRHSAYDFVQSRTVKLPKIPSPVQ